MANVSVRPSTIDFECGKDVIPVCNNARNISLISRLRPGVFYFKEEVTNFGRFVDPATSKLTSFYLISSDNYQCCMYGLVTFDMVGG